MSLAQQEPPAEEFHPFKLGRFAVLAPLGQGGMAKVYVAEYHGVGGFARRVVIKQIHEQHAANERFVKMFVDEANIASNLMHPNVVQVLDLQQDGPNLYMVLEYVDGLDLNSLFNTMVAAGQKVPVDVALLVAKEVLSGLEHAHGAAGPDGQPLNLIHRDITPGNVLLGRHGQVKLSDFGVARAVGRMTQTVVGEVKGKYSYMAPEVMQGDPYDQRSDVFGAGVVLWEALTTRPLFRGKSDFHVMEAVLRGPLYPPSTFNPDLPPGLDAVVMQGLERQMDARFQSARAFRRALQPLMARLDLDAAQERLAALVDRFGPPSNSSVSPRPSSMPPMPAVSESGTPPSALPAGPNTPAPAFTAPPLVPAGPSAAEKRRSSGKMAAVSPGAPEPSAFPPPPHSDPRWEDALGMGSPGPLADALPVPTPSAGPRAPTSAGLAPVGTPPAFPQNPPAPAASAPPASPPQATAPQANAPQANAPQAPIPVPPPPAASSPALPPVAQVLNPAWTQAPAPGEPAFFCVVGPDRTMLGPISTLSLIAVMQRTDGLSTDRVGVSPQALLPLGEAGRLLMLDHLVKPPQPAVPPSMQGQLKDLGVVRLLMTLATQRASGVLMLNAAQGAMAVYTADGCLQYAYLADPTHHLLSLFVTHQPNGMALLPQIISNVLRERISLPRVMAKAANLSASRVTAAVGALCRERFIHGLQWDACAYAFHPGIASPYELLPSRESVLTVLAPAISRLLGARELSIQAQKMVDRSLDFSSVDPALVGEMGLKGEVDQLKSLLANASTLRPGMGRVAPPGSPDETRLNTALVVLAQCGMLRDRG
jgi:serine/threonine protein kinase